SQETRALVHRTASDIPRTGWVRFVGVEADEPHKFVHSKPQPIEPGKAISDIADKAFKPETMAGISNVPVDLRSHPQRVVHTLGELIWMRIVPGMTSLMAVGLPDTSEHQQTTLYALKTEQTYCLFSKQEILDTPDGELE